MIRSYCRMPALRSCYARMQWRALCAIETQQRCHVSSCSDSNQRASYDVTFFTSTMFSWPSILALQEQRAIISSSDGMKAAAAAVAQRPLLRALAVVCPADVRRGRGNQVTPLDIKVATLALQLQLQQKQQQQQQQQQPSLIGTDIPVIEISSDVAFNMENYTIPAALLRNGSSSSSSSCSSDGSISHVSNTRSHSLGDCTRVAVVAAFGYKLSAALLSQFDVVLNLHPSLLPLYRGAAPLQHTLINGDTTTGVTVIQLNSSSNNNNISDSNSNTDSTTTAAATAAAAPKIDTGDVLWQQTVNIDADITYTRLAEQLSSLAAAGLITVLSDLPSHQRHAATQQQLIAVAGSSYQQQKQHAPKLQKQRGCVQWRVQTAAEVYNTFRALHGNMACFTYFEGKRVLITSMARAHSNNNNSSNNSVNSSTSTSSSVPPVATASQQPGSIYYSDIDHSVFVLCADRVWLCLLAVHVEFKRAAAPAREFYQNYVKKVSDECQRFESQATAAGTATATATTTAEATAATTTKVAAITKGTTLAYEKVSETPTAA